MRHALALLFAFAVVASAETTYTRDVARIIQVKCQQCHRPNDVAPFALTTYDDAVTYAADIKTALNNKTMPPWKPVPGFGNFADSFAITDDERNSRAPYPLTFQLCLPAASAYFMEHCSAVGRLEREPDGSLTISACLFPKARVL